MWNIKPGIFPKRIENLSKRPEVGLYQPLDYKGGHKNVKKGKGEGEIDFLFHKNGKWKFKWKF